MNPYPLALYTLSKKSVLEQSQFTDHICQEHFLEYWIHRDVNLLESKKAPSVPSERVTRVLTPKHYINFNITSLGNMAFMELNAPETYRDKYKLMREKYCEWIFQTYKDLPLDDAVLAYHNNIRLQKMSMVFGRPDL